MKIQAKNKLKDNIGFQGTSVNCFMQMKSFLMAEIIRDLGDQGQTLKSMLCTQLIKN